MVRFTLAEIADLLGVGILPTVHSCIIQHIQTDSRLPFPAKSLFIGLQGPNHNGSTFLEQAQTKGAQAAVVALDSNVHPSITIPVLKVPDPLRALQKIAETVHQQSGLKTLAITGSNGKTICKDLLVAMLGTTMQVTASPGSFNSQVGVALALLQLNPEAELAVVEAGISQEGEMQHLEAMVRPHFGILTNIGFSHLEGLKTQQTIANEKCKLFQRLPSSGWLLVPDDPHLKKLSLGSNCKHWVYGLEDEKELPKMLGAYRQTTNKTFTRWQFGTATVEVTIPIDIAWQGMFQTINAAVCAAYLLGVPPALIAETLQHFEPPHNYLEVWQSPLGFTLLNDSYSSDPVSVRAGLRTLGNFANKRKIVLFGGMQGLGEASSYQHQLVAEECDRQGVDLLITTQDLGKLTFQAYRRLKPDATSQHFPQLEAATRYLENSLGPNDCLLVKGPRALRFGTVSQKLKSLMSPTSMTINLSSIHHNLQIFRALFESKPKIMVMVKAFAYGMDAVVVTRYLQNHGVDYFGVAYLQEALELRRNGIHVPIAVQMVREEDAATVIQYGLQPVVYTEAVLLALADAAKSQGKKAFIHLKIDTGMGRFGLFPKDLNPVLEIIGARPELVLEGVMTHFSSADNAEADSFTQKQIATFETCLADIHSQGFQPTVVHAAATAGAVRFPQARFNLVRLGLGLYGIAPSKEVAKQLPQPLQCPFALVSKLGIIKHYPQGYPVSYNQRYKTCRPSKIGFIPMGYHDGISYGLANKGRVKIAGHSAPMVGAICMDFTAVDVTDIPDVATGNQVLILGSHQGHHIPVTQMAKQLNTIPYEILSRLSRRIQRIYHIEEH